MRNTGMRSEVTGSRTAPVATAYKPAASSGNARITQLALITPETDRMSPNAASNSSISAGISSSMVGPQHRAAAAGRLLR